MRAHCARHESVFYGDFLFVGLAKKNYATEHTFFFCVCDDRRGY